MADEEFVIVDSAGQEHAFPAGFDPKRAAAIVRGQSYRPDPTMAAFTRQAITARERPGMLQIRGRRVSDDPANDAPNLLTHAAQSIEGLAYPTSGGDVLGLLIPGGGGAAVQKVVAPFAKGVSKYAGAAMDLGYSLVPKKAQTALRILGGLKPTNWNSPLTVAGRGARSTAAAVDHYMPNTSTAGGPPVFDADLLNQRMPSTPHVPGYGQATEAGAVPRVKQAIYVKTADGYRLAPAVTGETLTTGERVNVSTRAGRQMMVTVPAAPPATGLSAAERAGMVKNGYTPDVIAKIEAQIRDSILGKLRDK